jgi:hypothetical protein
MGQVDDNGALLLGTESFDIYLGSDGRPFWNPEIGDWDYQLYSGLVDYPAIGALFSDLETMQSYDIIVINCGANVDYASFGDPQFLSRIRAFVQGGGRLYVTDQSYNFVEQAFPDFLLFQNSVDADPSIPEPLNAAYVGLSDITSATAVRDSGLAAWLGGLGALNDNGTLHVEDFLGGWSVMVQPHATQNGSQVKVWVEGPVTYEAPDPEVEFGSLRVEGVVRPLTVSFPYGSGKVIYTSYHTAGTPHPGFTPQERVLEYLLFL